MIPAGLALCRFSRQDHWNRHMARFEYLSVLVSIVLALGISEVIVCWARLIQHRRTVRFSWLHGLWTVIVLILMIQFWWGYWNFNALSEWRFSSLFLIVFETMLVVIASMLLTPGRTFEPGLDLEQLYFDNARPFFLIGALMLVSLSLTDVVVLGIAITDFENLIRMLALIVLVFMAYAEKRVYHFLAAGASGTLLLVFMTLAQVS